MDIIISILTCITIATIFFFIGKSFTKIIKPTSEEILGHTIENVKFLNDLHPIIQLIYKEFISENVKYFHVEGCYLNIKHLEIEIWSANDAFHREFRRIPTELLKEHDITLKELNNTLTMAEKKILDKIVKAVEVNNKEFISRIFV